MKPGDRYQTPFGVFTVESIYNCEDRVITPVISGVINGTYRCTFNLFCFQSGQFKLIKEPEMKEAPNDAIVRLENAFAALADRVYRLECGAAKMEYKNPKEYKISYDNDTGPEDDYFIETWTVANDEKSFKCDSAEDAVYLMDMLNGALNA